MLTLLTSGEQEKEDMTSPLWGLVWWHHHNGDVTILNLFSLLSIKILKMYVTNQFGKSELNTNICKHTWLSFFIEVLYFDFYLFSILLLHQLLSFEHFLGSFYKCSSWNLLRKWCGLVQLSYATHNAIYPLIHEHIGTKHSECLARRTN